MTKFKKFMDGLNKFMDRFSKELHTKLHTEPPKYGSAIFFSNLGALFIWLAVFDNFRGNYESAISKIYIAAAFGALVGLYLTMIRTISLTKQTETAERNLVVERFTRAVGQLGDGENITVRTGGVYALEMIARTSKEERASAIQTIAAFVRNRTSDYPVEKVNSPDEHMRNHSQFSDVETAVRVAAWLADEKERCALSLYYGEREQDEYCVDFSFSRLMGLDMSHCNLSGFDLSGVNFSGSGLIDVNFSKSDLSVATFDGARLFFSNFDGAQLNDTDFGGAKGLKTDSLANVVYFKETPPKNLPPGVKLPPPYDAEE